jgi:ribosome-associated protein
VTDAAPRKRTTRAATKPATVSATEPATSEPPSDAADGTTPTAKVRRADGLPRRGTSPAAEERSSLDLARRIVELAEDKKAADIVLLDLSPLTTVADYFVICSGGSERQLEAIAGGVISGMRDERVRPFGREGTAASHWILVDFGSVIVHVFTPPERDFYQLERHWAEAKTVLRLQ